VERSSVDYRYRLACNGQTSFAASAPSGRLRGVLRDSGSASGLRQPLAAMGQSSRGGRLDRIERPRRSCQVSTRCQLRMRPYLSSITSVSTRLHRPFEQLEEEFDDWLAAIAGDTASAAAQAMKNRRARSSNVLRQDVMRQDIVRRDINGSPQLLDNAAPLEGVPRTNGSARRTCMDAMPGAR
jgi:hypothetical protein